MTPGCCQIQKWENPLEGLGRRDKVPLGLSENQIVCEMSSIFRLFVNCFLLLTIRYTVKIDQLI